MRKKIIVKLFASSWYIFLTYSRRYGYLELLKRPAPDAGCRATEEEW